MGGDEDGEQKSNPRGGGFGQRVELGWRPKWPRWVSTREREREGREERGEEREDESVKMKLRREKCL